MPTPLTIGGRFDVSGHGGDFTVVGIVNADHIEAGRGDNRPLWRLVTLHSPDHGYACGFLSGTVESNVFMSGSCALCIRGTIADSPEVSLSHLLAKMNEISLWHARRVTIVADQMALLRSATPDATHVDEDNTDNERLPVGFHDLEMD